jgi:2-polyprenyl-6-hydroxyphenyl methylase / 3-demethylubiquinone-9 3-methyltransferase
MMAKTSISDRQVSSAERSCIVCGHPLDVSAHVRAGSVHLFRCAECETWTSLPRVTASDQAAIHDSAGYFEHPYFQGRRDLSRRMQDRCREVFERMSVAIDPNSLRGERLLDVGCDTGRFLEAAVRQLEVVPVGLDVASRAVRAASSAGIETYQATIESAPSHLTGFRAITAIDVVEHVADPAAFLSAVRDRLAPRGAVYLETPNSRSAVYRLGRVLCSLTNARPQGVFERLFPPQHIQYFTPQSFDRLVRGAGLEIVRIGTRILPWQDLATSFPVRAAMSLLQSIDRFAANEILIWAVLRRENTCN